MREAEFQQRITDMCDWLHLRWHHETDSRRSKSGFPDLCIVGNEVIFAELKSETGKVTFDQQGWCCDLEAAGVEAHVWRPSDWPEVQRRLLRLAGRNI